MKKYLPINCLFFCCVIVSSIKAQVQYGSILGRVVDGKSNTSIYRANIVLTSNSLKSPRQMQTSEAGYFVFDSLNTQATYSIQITKESYQSFINSYSFPRGQTSFNIGSVSLQQITSLNTQQDISTYVKATLLGRVVDAKSNTGIYHASVVLSSNSLRIPRQMQTSEAGYFVFDSLNTQATYSIQITKENYQSFINSYSFPRGQASFNIGSVSLQQITLSNSQQDTATYVKTTLIKNNQLPTKGGTELFYLLNPELKNAGTVPSNYKVKWPVFPKKDLQKEKQFNDQFKKDKRKDTSFFTQYKKPLPRVMTNSFFEIGSLSKASFSSLMHTGYLMRDYYEFLKEKFVFVMFKTDQNGQPITTGYEVENRFLVYYKGLYKEGDTSTYHRTRDASYGYATMAKAVYKIIVIDQLTGRQVRISDPIIDTNEYFEAAPVLFKLLNIHPSWIKIPIHVYD